MTKKYRILALVAIIGLSIWYSYQINHIRPIQPEKTPVTSNDSYRTYVNKKYGYSFEYPATVLVSENKGGLGYLQADDQSDLILLQNRQVNDPSQAYGIEPVEYNTKENLLSYVKRETRYRDGYLEVSGEPYDIMPRRIVLKLNEFTVDERPVVEMITRILPDQGSVEDVYYYAWIEYAPGKILSIGDYLASYHPLEFDQRITRSFRFMEPSLMGE